MHSTTLFGFLAILYLAVATVQCDEGSAFVENCKERIAQCKKSGADEKDEKKAELESKCYATFMCKPEEDTERQLLMMDAGARTAAARGNRFKNNAQTKKMPFQILAACLMTVFGVMAHT